MNDDPPTYDPLEAPDVGWWLELDEGERNQLVEDYHRRARVEVPNLRMHSIFHAIVETQAAAGDELAVARTLARLQSAGLDRHDALHAIGSVLGECLHGLMTHQGTGGDPSAAYAAALEKLDARAWLHGR